MTSQSNDTALLLMDLQNEMVSPQGKFGQAGLAKASQERGVIEHSKAMLDGFRERHLPVVFVRLGFREDYADALSVSARVAKLKQMRAAILGSWGTEFPEALSPLPEEMIITKQCVNPFFNTPLLTWLLTRGVRRLALCGVATNNVVESAARFADDAGFENWIIEDCCASANPQWHQFAVANTLPLFGRITSSQEFLGSLGRPNG